MTLTAPGPQTKTKMEALPLLTAVTYQRVSTKEQASKGGRDEGFSIPAQREANARKAESLGARVVAEFVDAGESARSADRPDLQRMLEYIATHQVNFCIVHKVDRLARNRLDDVEIHRRLVQAGVTLVSATENIDETPSGDAAARDHVEHRGVLLQEPRHRGRQRLDAEVRDRRHPDACTHRLPQRPQA
ncbi:MAG: recombinase family protein [Actinomycetota bacterium]|nr:recombinase family protein [Actinomycetota bacterium]